MIRISQAVKEVSKIRDEVLSEVFGVEEGDESRPGLSEEAIATYVAAACTMLAVSELVDALPNTGRGI